MKALIMAAGRGERISRHIHGKPKCCLQFEGESLIRRSVRILSDLGIQEIGIVTGYQSGLVLKELESFQVVKFYNPFFDVTNSIASLWFAREFFTRPEEVLIMNGDLFIDEDLIRCIYEDQRSPVFLADSSRTHEADYRFVWKEDKLHRYGKGIPDDEASGEYVGIGKLNADFTVKFLSKLDEMILSQRHGSWWEDVLYSFIGTGTEIFVKDVAGLFWAEVDYIEDFKRVENYLAETR